MEYPSKKLDPKWVTGEIPIDESVVKWLESFGKYLAISNENDPKSLTASQIRKFFGEVKKIQADFDRKKGAVVFLGPKLAYAVGRDYNVRNQRANSKIEEFYKEIKTGISAVGNDKSKFFNLVNIVEAIVAYHRLYGGKVQ